MPQINFKTNQEELEVSGILLPIDDDRPSVSASVSSATTSSTVNNLNYTQQEFDAQVFNFNNFLIDGQLEILDTKSDNVENIENIQLLELNSTIPINFFLRKRIESITIDETDTPSIKKNILETILVSKSNDLTIFNQSNIIDQNNVFNTHYFGAFVNTPPSKI